MVGDEAVTPEEQNNSPQKEEAATEVEAPRQRTRHAPVWMRDYVSGETGYSVADGEDIFAMVTVSEDPDT